ncbi:hypothetical protein [Pseudomonas putida]|uniref:Uncharacterized protein n=1 Tax=Pseudomonas putida TaxID=303 RepID=A0A6I7ES17_PSEPU|nr:hypothetical protein [Pseudomonas putida]QHW08395.1 hypothetical protein C2H86_28540 [Pseudomonas putida]
MSILIWLHLLSYYLALAIITGISVLYLTRSQFMPYHAEAVGRSWHEVDPAMQNLLLTIIRLLGWAWLAIACAGALIFNLLSVQNSPLGQWVLFQSFCLLATLPVILFICLVKRRTGASPLLMAAVLPAVLSCLGFICVLLVRAQG